MQFSIGQSVVHFIDADRAKVDPTYPYAVGVIKALPQDDNDYYQIDWTFKASKEEGLKTISASYPGSVLVPFDREVPNEWYEQLVE